ncbi:hypothetical protein PMAYCL1PPCAC_07961, partial [Pristionchus mayeri]
LIGRCRCDSRARSPTRAASRMCHVLNSQQRAQLQAPGSGDRQGRLFCSIMAKSVALLSKSNRLIVSLLNENCDFSISDDHTTLVFQPAHKIPISSVHLQLISSAQEEIQSYKLPFHTRGRMGSVRIDALYPTVFGESQQIESVVDGNPSFLSWRQTDESTTFILQVKLNFDGELTLPTVTKISSASVNIGSVSGAVSKEVLGLNSDYFLTLFYGDFVERSSGSYNIKEVDPDEFKSFINSITERKWRVKSVVHALSILTLADRFCCPNVLKRILPYIKEFKLDTKAKKNRVTTLRQCFDIASRCSDNGEFVSWIFESCETAMELSEVGQSCGTALTPHLKEFFRFLAIKHANEKRMETERMYRERQALHSHLQTHTCQPHGALASGWREVAQRDGGRFGGYGGRGGSRGFGGNGGFRGSGGF